MTVVDLDRYPLARRRTVRVPEALAYSGVTVAWLAFRLGSFSGIGDRVTDTVSYEHTATFPFWSASFWAGDRGFTIPLLYKLVPALQGRIVAQLAISVFAWLVLAAVAAAQARQAASRVLLFAAVLCFSLTTEVILWDTMLLSESVSLSLLALLLAAWLMLVRRSTWPRVATVLVLSLLWTFARDTDAYVVLMTGCLAGLSLARPPRTRLNGALAIGLIAVFGLATMSADGGERWRKPLVDVLQFRVMETPAMLAYFERRGLNPATNWSRYGGFVDRSGRRTYAEYLLTHPTYTFTAPFTGRQKALYSTPRNSESLLDPSMKTYDDNASHRPLPFPALLRHAFFPRGVVLVLALVAAVLGFSGAVAARCGPARSWFVPLGALLTVYPQFLLDWHLSGEEVDRHALVPALMLRLAPLLLLGLIVDRALDSRINARQASRA